MKKNHLLQFFLWTAIIGLAVAAGNAEEIYKEDFKEKTTWTAVPSAELSPYGRSGPALKISTYVKDGEKSRWDSPSIAIKPGVCTVSAWLAENLTFPFTVTREEDEDDAYFLPGAADKPFRLGHKMMVVGLEEDDVNEGVMVKVAERRQTGYVPLCDVEVKPKTDNNFWPVREYVVWFANRC